MVDSNTILFTIQLDKIYNQMYILLPTNKYLFLQGYELSLDEKAKQSHNFLSSILLNNLLNYRKELNKHSKDREVNVFSINALLNQEFYFDHLNEAKSQSINDFFTLFLKSGKGNSINTEAFKFAQKAVRSYAIFIF